MIDLHQFSFHVGEHLAIIASQRGKTRIDYSLTETTKSEKLYKKKRDWLWLKQSLTRISVEQP